MTPPIRFHAEFAWLGGTAAEADVLIETDGDRITAVTPGVPAPPGARRLPGLTMPGLANTHSHVFHRAIRGHSQSGVADFWRWRDLMYGVAERLDPDLLYELALATYAEMALSGITSVGEFHYVHHGPDGRRYRDHNAMGRAVVRAANDSRPADHPARRLLPAGRCRWRTHPRRAAPVRRRFLAGVGAPDGRAH